MTHIWGSGTVASRTVDVTETTSGAGWDELTARALANPPPYRPAPGGAICHIQVDDQVVIVAERDLDEPLLDLVAAVLDHAEAADHPAAATPAPNRTQAGGQVRTGATPAERGPW